MTSDEEPPDTQEHPSTSTPASQQEREAWLRAQLEAAAPACESWGVVPSRLHEALLRSYRSGPLPATLFLDDLVLALACADGLARAQRELDRRASERIAQSARRVDPSAAFAEEVRQAVRERLLLGSEGGTPRILEYSGRGPLAAWVGVVAMRLALNLRRGVQPLSLDERLVTGLSVPSPDPELALIKSEYREAFQRAFRAALATLEDTEVNVLRLHFSKGLNIDDIGRTYGVHRATVARWIARARERLLVGIRRQLMDSLRLGPEEFESLMEMVRSQVHLSLSKGLEP
ncbi:RNA polymerase subunit sigma-70 [Archangium violaceum]|nr:RNA polymerase subunit sigma-70 [Archangium violaceum]